MIKNHFLSLAVLALGFGLVFTQSAFKPEKNARVQYKFHYTGPLTMLESEVENESNWTYEPDATCPTGDAQPCAIRIDQAYVDNTGPNPVLDPSALINASDLGSGKAIVIGSADGSAQYLNTEF